MTVGVIQQGAQAQAASPQPIDNTQYVQQYPFTTEPSANTALLELPWEVEGGQNQISINLVALACMDS